MARKNEKVVIEDVELKPQVIGHIYEKKSNIGRVLVIFVVFGLVIYFINDISVFVNDLLGKKSASSIQDIASDDNKKSIINKKDKNEDYYEISDNLVLVIEELTINNFKHENNILSFDIYNYTEKDIDLSNKEYYLETYDESKEIKENSKLEIGNIEKKNKKDMSVNLNDEFKYIRIIEKQ